jgi:hypothetical protein
MSSILTGAEATQETALQEEKGQQSFLSSEERGQIQRYLNHPEDFPRDFGSWMLDFVAVNGLKIPVSQILGFEKYTRSVEAVQTLLYSSGTSLPASPTDGQVFGLEVNSTTIWNFRYDSAIGDSYKWVFTGGAPMEHTVLTSQTRTGTTAYGDLTTVGPTVTVPNAGIYQVIFGCYGTLTFVGALVLASPHYGSSPSDNDAASHGTPGGGTMVRGALITVTSAAQEVKIQYRITDGADTGGFSRRWMLLTPVRVS